MLYHFKKLQLDDFLKDSKWEREYYLVKDDLSYIRLTTYNYKEEMNETWFRGFE